MLPAMQKYCCPCIVQRLQPQFYYAPYVNLYRPHEARTAPLRMLARRTPFPVDTAAPALGAPGVPGAGAGAAAAPKSVVSKSMTSATLASDAPPAVACTRLSGGAPLGVAVACAVLRKMK